MDVQNLNLTIGVRLMLLQLESGDCPSTVDSWTRPYNLPLPMFFAGTILPEKQFLLEKVRNLGNNKL